MTWIRAEKEIRKAITIGTDLNTMRSNHRKVTAIRRGITSNRYCYFNAEGYQVKIGASSTIAIPFNMLKECYGATAGASGYDGNFFRQHFPKQAADHPCHVHVVGQILIMAGLAKLHRESYRAV
jgi:hypothetical protein